MYRRIHSATKSLEKIDQSQGEEFCPSFARCTTLLALFHHVYYPLKQFNKTCLKGLGWDDQIPEPCKQKCQSWLKELPKLEQFEILRCFKRPNCSDIQLCELHHFSDASSQDYGAVSYLRQIDIHGEVHCSLIMAKSKLAPLKAMTIPRMELSAAVLATRLDRRIKQEVDMAVHSSTFWTDSTCVLRYIENKDKIFQIFVANRVSAILDQSTAAQWRYVESTLNPADEASRGMTVDELLMNER